MPGYPKILLFSTLNPFPFWAGSENFWFDFVMDERVKSSCEFHCHLAKSSVTREKGKALSGNGAQVKFYDHFNVSFGKRNFYRIRDKVNKSSSRTLPWYNQIKKEKYNMVWFNVAELGDLQDLVYPVSLCKKQGIPYWLILQHGFEDFFLSSKQEIETVSAIASGAVKFIFIADRNKMSLERAIGMKLSNSFHSVNALPAEKIAAAKRSSENNWPKHSGTARFFNLGRFSPKDKAQHLLLEVFSDTSWKQRDWQLRFIGVSHFGEYYLQKLCQFYGIAGEKIKIESFTHNVFDTIAENDVLLMPSMAEGTPFAMIESMACGRPALGTPVGGIPELIIEGQTGWLSHSTNADDLGAKLETTWTERSKWEQYGRNAQQLVNLDYNQRISYAVLLKELLADTNHG